MDLYAAMARFSLGLPARREDAEAIRHHLPELLSGDSEIDELAALHWFLGPRAVLVSSKEFGKALRQWLRSSDDGDATPLVTGGPVEDSCPLGLPSCPNNTDASGTGAPEATESTDDDDFESIVFRLMAMGGGAVGDGANRFLDLFRKTTKGYRGARIKQVILTDRFLHTSFDEVGNDGGGFQLLCDLMGVLDLSHNSEFEVLVSPQLGGAYDLVAKRIEDVFKHAQVSQFQVDGRIHDRFYIVRGTDGQLSGVFGPSLNGLKGKAIFLMGDLDEVVLDKLDSVIR